MPTQKVTANYDAVFNLYRKGDAGKTPGASQRLTVTAGAGELTLYCVRASDFDFLNGKQVRRVSASVFYERTYHTKCTALSYVLKAPFARGAAGETAEAALENETRVSATAGTYSEVKVASGAGPLCKQALTYGIAVRVENYDDTANISTVPSGKAPFFTVEYGEIMCKPKDCVPSAGFVNEKTENTFSWGFEYDAQTSFGTPVLRGCILHWRQTGAAAYHTQSGPLSDKIVVPAGTFTGASIDWRVVLVSQDGTQGEPSPWATLTTIDAPSAPRALYPKNLPIDGTRPVTFTWAHEIATGTEQTRYELQTSADGGKTWAAFSTEYTARQSCTATANAFAAGQTTWRVRTYNSDGAPGAWSEAASFIVRAAPTCAVAWYTGQPRPVLGWQSSGQQGYQVTIGGHESGTVYGTAKEYRCPVYLADGTHAAAVRVQNAFGMWSAWAHASIPVKNTPGAAITLLTSPVPYGARLAWEGAGYTHFIVYRGNAAIASTREKTYTDYEAAGVNTYRVRGITAEDDYTDSTEQAEYTRLRHAAIAAVGEYRFLPLIFRQGESNTHSIMEDCGVTYQHYAGRALPVAETSGEITRTHSLDYSLEQWEDVERLQGMAGRLVIWKHARGERARGILALASIVRGAMWDVGITITEISEGGGVDGA